MTSLPDPASETEPAGWWGEVNRLDLAVYAAIAATPTPTLDRAFRRLSQAADYSKLWLASAALLAATGGASRPASRRQRPGRRPGSRRRSSTWS